VWHEFAKPSAILTWFYARTNPLRPHHVSTYYKFLNENRKQSCKNVNKIERWKRVTVINPPAYLYYSPGKEYNESEKLTIDALITLVNCPCTIVYTRYSSTMTVSSSPTDLVDELCADVPKPTKPSPRGHRRLPCRRSTQTNSTLIAKQAKAPSRGPRRLRACWSNSNSS
jgi:hypothetical protein